MADFTLIDNSQAVKDALDNMVDLWLDTWGNEIAAQAKRGVVMDDDNGIQLRKDYRADVDKVNDKAKVGATLESAYWEEFGTGSHADMGKNGGIPGRPEWWVYVKNETPRVSPENRIYRTEAEAKAVAAAWRAEGKDAYATNGRDPNYTLEKAYTTTKSRAINDLESKLRRLE